MGEIKDRALQPSDEVTIEVESALVVTSDIDDTPEINAQASNED